MPSRFRDLFNSPTKLVYFTWRALQGSFAVRLRTVSGVILRMRPWATGDYGMAYEVFVLEPYSMDGSFPIDDCREVVDLGANVGYASLYLANRFPKAHIQAFEPHPLTFEALKENIRINGLENRVTLFNVAASTQQETAFLTDATSSSTVIKEHGPGRLPIKVVDFFSCVGQKPIDLLKMDIEGGEYRILADERFASLPVRCLVLEWHNNEEFPDGKKWCVSRLSQLGYEIEDRMGAESAGIIAAFRRGDQGRS